LNTRRPSAFELLRLEKRASARRLLIDGVEWLAYELPPQELDRRCGASLVFESASMMRRVRGYPSNWRSLSDEELAAISWSR
jgi:hypothetical protein